MLYKRVLTVIIGAPIVMGAIICPYSWIFKILAAVCLLVALMEFFSIIGFGLNFTRLEKWFAIGIGFLHLAYLLFFPDAKFYLVIEMSLFFISIFTFHCFNRDDVMEGKAAKIALTVLGGLYIGTFGALVGLIRDMPHGVYWVFTLLAMTWLNDTFAYFFGHRFGKHKLAPHISPGKTIEGFLGGFLGTLTGFLAFWFLFKNPVSIFQGLVLTFLIGCLGPVGDLSESLIKRSFKVKDSGNIIPGHGGMLDRIDALLFTAPVVYAFISILGVG